MTKDIPTGAAVEPTDRVQALMRLADALAQRHYEAMRAVSMVVPDGYGRRTLEAFDATRTALETAIRAVLAHPAATAVPAIGFSPMHLAPIDGTPVLLHMPTTGDKFAIGRWSDRMELWCDDEGNGYAHHPTGWMGLHVLERIASASPAAQDLGVSAPLDVLGGGALNTLGDASGPGSLSLRSDDPYRDVRSAK
jgi:hypothetical protein